MPPHRDAYVMERCYTGNIDGLVQDCSYSSALAMELLQSCTKPPICIHYSTHWEPNKMVYTLEYIIFFHENRWIVIISNITVQSMYLMALFTISQYWFGLWLGTELATSHYPNRWWSWSLAHTLLHTSPGLNALKFKKAKPKYRWVNYLRIQLLTCFVDFLGRPRPLESLGRMTGGYFRGRPRGRFGTDEETIFGGHPNLLASADFVGRPRPLRTMTVPDFGHPTSGDSPEPGVTSGFGFGGRPRPRLAGEGDGDVISRDDLRPMTLLEFGPSASNDPPEPEPTSGFGLGGRPRPRLTGGEDGDDISRDDLRSMTQPGFGLPTSGDSPEPEVTSGLGFSGRPRPRLAGDGDGDDISEDEDSYGISVIHSGLMTPYVDICRVKY